MRNPENIRHPYEARWELWMWFYCENFTVVAFIFHVSPCMQCCAEMGECPAWAHSIQSTSWRSSHRWR